MIIATGSLTLLHPGVCFQGYWRVGREAWLGERGIVEEMDRKDGDGVDVGIQNKEVKSTAACSVKDVL